MLHTMYIQYLVHVRYVYVTLSPLAPVVQVPGRFPEIRSRVGSCHVTSHGGRPLWSRLSPAAVTNTLTAGVELYIYLLNKS